MESCTRPNVNICPVCGVDKGKGRKLYGHLFDAHDYTKAQIEDLKRVRRTGKVLTAGKPVISCEICGSCFTHNSAYNVHQRRKHPERYKMRTISCPLCDAEMSECLSKESVSFSSRSSMFNDFERPLNEGEGCPTSSPAAQNQGRQGQSQSHHELVKHAHMSHATKEDDYTVKNVTFKSPQEYKEWKERAEKASMIKHFVSSSNVSDGVKTTRLRCSRAFRSLNQVPKKTRKTVAYCTAYMKVVESGDQINVEHCFTHCCQNISPAISNKKQSCPRSNQKMSQGEQEKCKAEPLYVEDYNEDTVPPRRRSRDNGNEPRDALWKIELAYEEIRSTLLALSSLRSDEALQVIKEVAEQMSEFSEYVAAARVRLLGEENTVKAQRAEASSAGRSQGSTPIRKTHRRAYSLRGKQTKRSKVDNL